MAKFVNPAGRSLSKLAKRLAFSKEFHGEIKVGIRAGKDCSQIAEYDRVRLELDAIWEASKHKVGATAEVQREDGTKSDSDADKKSNEELSLDADGDIGSSHDKLSIFDKATPDENERSSVWKI